MRYYLVTDNRDTLVGMRLSGIEGVIVNDPGEVRRSIEAASAHPDVGVLIITERLAAMCRDYINDMKLTVSRPLIVEIPDRHGTTRSADSITRYIRESIGIKL